MWTVIGWPVSYSSDTPKCPITAQTKVTTQTKHRFRRFHSFDPGFWQKVWESVWLEMRRSFPGMKNLLRSEKHGGRSRILNNAFPCHWPRWSFPGFPLAHPPPLTACGCQYLIQCPGAAALSCQKSPPQPMCQPIAHTSSISVMKVPSHNLPSDVFSLVMSSLLRMSPVSGWGLSMLR